MILVIDDSLSVHYMMQFILPPVGIEIVAAYSGEEGIQQWQIHVDRIKAVLLDLHMPGMGGVATFYQLRELTPSLPIIIYTSVEPAEALRYFPNQPTITVLEKSCSPTALLAMLKSFLQSSPNGEGLSEEKEQ